MRVVAALGGYALLRHGEPMDADVQITHVAQAVAALAPIADEHELLITHGNGPQIGLLALESEADAGLSAPYPLDALGAQTQGMIGYWLARELRRIRPGLEIVAVLTTTVVDQADPAFARPAKFVGRGFTDEEARRFEDRRGWTFRRDGASLRRVVPSPEPRDVVELPTIERLLGRGRVVIAAGGGGTPTAAGPEGPRGAEAVVDKDLTAALIADRLDADALLLLTDVPAIIRGFGSDDPEPIVAVSPAGLRHLDLPAGSMGPKAEAACRFAEHRPGSFAAIGALRDASALLDRRAGTCVAVPEPRHHDTCTEPMRSGDDMDHDTTPAEAIRVTASAGATDQDVARAREVVAKVLDHAHEPALHTRVTLAKLADPAVPQPALVSVRVDLNGRPVNVHAAAPTMPEAIARAGDRLRIRLERTSRDWEARRGGHHDS